MRMFRQQHPQDLVSRLFILEFMRSIGPNVLYTKANPLQKEQMFYKFINGSDIEEVDLNWEYCLFVASLRELENFLENFEEELQAIIAVQNAKLKVNYEKEVAEPASISVYDMAQADIRENRDITKLKIVK